MRKPYEAANDHNGKPYVSGPDLRARGTFSYHGGTLDPQSRCESHDEAVRSARKCNEAYSAGYAAAMAEMRDLINRTEAPK